MKYFILYVGCSVATIVAGVCSCDLYTSIRPFSSAERRRKNSFIDAVNYCINTRIYRRVSAL